MGWDYDDIEVCFWSSWSFIKDLCSNNDNFGGKVIVVSGDFRQTLPVGDGVFKTEFERNNEVINIPNEILSNGDILTEFFGDIIKPNDKEFQQSVILAPKTIDVLELNNEILCRIDDTVKEYLSIDVADDADNRH